MKICNKSTISKLCLMLTILVSGCTKTTSPQKEIALRLEPGPDNPRNSEGDFIQLKDGRILFVYTHFTGGSGDNASAGLAGRFSTDNGRTWSKEDTPVLSNEGDMNTMSVSLIRLSDERIALFYLRKNSETDCRPYMRISDDEAETWGEAKLCIAPIGYYVMNNDRVVRLKNGRILLPVALHQSPQMERSRGAHIMCYYSDDEGENWHQSNQVPNPGKIVLQEPGIVELKNGELMIFCRSDAGSQHLAFSKNQGINWSEIQPGPIRSPMSPASIERLPATGDLLLVWNNNYDASDGDGGLRTPFTLAVSEDEGKTWVKTKNVEGDPQGWYCYTAIEFVDNTVLLGHCAGNRRQFNGLETTQITRLNLDWIYSDPTPDPFIISDKDGLVVLGCPLPESEIHFTLDANPPDKSSPRYEQPIHVTKTTTLSMQAFHSDRTPSAIINASVGSDVFQEPPDPAIKTKPGLFCNYYEGEAWVVNDISKLPLIKTFIVPEVSIEQKQSNENFAFIFQGYIKIPADGRYTFFIASNDGSRLNLNGEKFIDNDGPHAIKEVSNATSLRQGIHEFELMYFQTGGESDLKIFWAGPEFGKRELEAAVLFH